MSKSCLLHYPDRAVLTCLALRLRSSRYGYFGSADCIVLGDIWKDVPWTSEYSIHVFIVEWTRCADMFASNLT